LDFSAKLQKPYANNLLILFEMRFNIILRQIEKLAIIKSNWSSLRSNTSDIVTASLYFFGEDLWTPGLERIWSSLCLQINSSLLFLNKSTESKLFRRKFKRY